MKIKAHSFVFFCLFVFFLSIISASAYHQRVMWRSGVLDLGRGVAVDDDNNVFLAAQDAGPFFGMVKYDENGTYQWDNTAVGVGDAYDVTVDYDNDVIFVGYLGNDFYTLKVDTDGNLIWFDSHNVGGVDRAYSVVHDSHNNVIVVGSVNGLTDMHIIKYQPDSTQDWIATYDSGGIDAAYGVAVDFIDDIVIVGGANDDFIIRKYDADGAFVWQQTFDPGPVAAYLNDVAIDPQDNVIVVGSYNNVLYHVRKYDRHGVFLWGTTLSGVGNPYVAIDPASNIYVSGTVGNSAFVYALDQSGNSIWQEAFDWNAAEVGRGIAIDSQNRLVIGGDSSAGNAMVFQVRSSNCTLSSTTMDNQTNLTWSGAYTRNCFLTSSTMNISNADSVTLISSSVYNVSMKDSFLSNSKINNSVVEFSVIENTIFPCDGLILNGKVEAGRLTEGELYHHPYHYFAPFDISSICAGASPATGTLTAVPSVFRNGSAIRFELFSSGIIGLRSIVNLSAFGYGPVKLRLYDDGFYPDSSKSDAIYSRQIINTNDSDMKKTVYVYVDDNRGNDFIFSTDVTVDNIIPNASIQINGGTKNVTGRSVDLDLQYNDANGIYGCRYSNYNLSALTQRCTFTDGYVCEDMIWPRYRQMERRFIEGVLGQGFNASEKSQSDFTWQSNPSVGTDLLSGIAFDGMGNIITSGTETSGGNSIFNVIKLDKKGNLQWNYRYNPSAGADVLEDVAVDSYDQVIAAGSSNVPGNIQFHVIKLDPLGNLIWNWTYNPSGSGDYLKSVAIDSQDNIIVAGYDNALGNYQFHVVKLDQDGNFLWEWTSNPSVGTDRLEHVAIDDMDYVIVSGYSNVPGNDQFHVVKLGPDGAFQWEWTSNSGALSDRLYGATVDSGNNILVSGFSTVAVTGGRFHVVKLSSGGSQMWEWVYDPSAGADYCQAVDVDQYDDVFCAGYSNEPGWPQFHVIKLDPMGRFIWNYTDSISASDSFYDIAVNKNDEIAVVGSDRSPGNDQFVIQKLRPSPERLIFDNDRGQFNRAEGSISLWFADMPDGSTTKTLFVANNTVGDSVFNIFLEDDDVVFRWFNGTGNTTLRYNPQFPWLDGEWHHVSVTYKNYTNGSHEAALFIDGSLVNQTLNGTDYPVSDVEFFEIGSGPGNSYGNKLIDEFMLFSYQKNESSVSEDYLELSNYEFSTCVSRKPWLLTDGAGNKTVWFQARDNAGNMKTAQDRIELVLLGDMTPPENLQIFLDSLYTNIIDRLHARWSAFDFASNVYYRYRIWNETQALFSWIDAPDFRLAEKVTRSGLSLAHNHSYRVQLEACNYNEICSYEVSHNITIDTEKPFTPVINSTTHLNDTWVNDKSVSFHINCTDNLSHVAGYSYFIDLTKNSEPDRSKDLLIYPQTYWNWTYDPNATGIDRLVSVAIDKDDNTYFAGTDMHDGLSDMHIVSLDDDGVFRWNISYAPCGNGGVLDAIAIDRDSNIIVAGYDYCNAGDEQFHVAKFNSTADHQWNWTDNPAGSPPASLDRLTSVAVDSHGDIIVAGHDELPADNHYRIRVIKLASSGNLIWNWTYDPGNINPNMINDIAVDRDNDIIVAGVHYPAGSPALFIAKINSTGNHTWNWSLDLGVVARFNGVAIDSEGDIIAVGLKEIAGVSAYYVVKLDDDGNHIWNLTFNPTALWDELYDVDIDSRDNIIAVGMSDMGGVDDYKQQVIKLDQDGVFLWNWTGDPSVDADGLEGIVVNSKDSIITAGYDLDPGFEQMDVIKLSHVGDQEFHEDAWVDYNYLGDGGYWFHVIAVDNAGNWGPSSHYRLMIDTTPASTPQMYTMSNTVSSPDITFTWTESIDFASGVKGYYLRVDDDLDFSSPEFEQWVGNVTSAIASMPANGTWYGSVRSLNGADINSTWSNQVKQEIDQIPPSITMMSPRPGSVFATITPVFIAQTDEPSDCVMLINGTYSYPFDYTGQYYHETSRDFLDESDYTVLFRCTDSIGNVNQTSTESFLISTSIQVNSIANFKVSNKNYANNLCNVSGTLYDVGMNPISGITNERASMKIDGLDFPAFSLKETGLGQYQFYYLCPDSEGIHSIELDIDTATAGNSFIVSIARFFMEFMGTIANKKTIDHIVYGYNPNGVLGFGTETILGRSNRTSSPLRLGGQVGKNGYIFLTDPDGRKQLDDVDELLRKGMLLDSSEPSFGDPDGKDTQVIGLTLDYDKIYFSTAKTLNLGLYQILVTNNGRFRSGEKRGMINMSVKLR